MPNSEVSVRLPSIIFDALLASKSFFFVHSSSSSFTLVFSHLDYWNFLLVGLPSSSIDKLQKVQNCVVRLVTLDAQGSTLASRASTNWIQSFPFPVSLSQQLCTLLPDQLVLVLPSSSLFWSISSGPSLRIVWPPLCTSLSNKDMRRSSFFYLSATICGPRIWNALPEHIRLPNVFPSWNPDKRPTTIVRRSLLIPWVYILWAPLIKLLEGCAIEMKYIVIIIWIDLFLSYRVKLLNPDRTKTLQISAKKFDFFACVFENELGVS